MHPAGVQPGAQRRALPHQFGHLYFGLYRSGYCDFTAVHADPEPGLPQKDPCSCLTETKAAVPAAFFAAVNCCLVQ